MRIPVILALILSTALFASSDREMTELFLKYDSIMNSHKVELIDEVFTEKFLKEVGGKEEFIKNIQELPKADAKMLKPTPVRWKKGTQDEIYFVKRLETSKLKSKAAPEAKGPSFVIIKDNGKLKINGTIGDDH